MTEYQLQEVRKDGKAYSNCTLEIDEGKRYVRVKGKRGLRREPVQVVDFYYDASTVIEVDGERLRVADLVMVAASLSDAQAIAQSIRLPTVEVGKQAEGTLEEIEAAAQSFLEAREAAISTLLRLKNDPRGTLIDVYGSGQTLTGDPVEQLYLTSQASVSKSKDAMEAVIQAAGWKVGNRVVERLYAFCYAAGKLQDAFFSGSAEDVEDAKKFLVEIGIRRGDIRDVSLEGSSKRLMGLAHEVLSSMVELPRQTPERSALLGPPKKA